MGDLHIGLLIRQKIAERKLSVKDFAEAIYCSRTNAYSIFKRRNIDLRQLEVISRVLEYDFLSEVYIDAAKRGSLALNETNGDKLRQLMSDPEIDIIMTWCVNNK
jgi:DNA-binding Xre family transcriptional regulator